jgi:hypothetical protein
MSTLLIIVVVLLSLAVLILAGVLFLFVRKYDHIPDKDKEFIEFTIDMYIQYAEELKINSPTQHKKIIEQLERIKNKYLKIDGKKN